MRAFLLLLPASLSALVLGAALLEIRRFRERYRGSWPAGPVGDAR